MAEYRDSTPISPKEPEYDKSKVSKKVANYTQQVREKRKGHDVREALARNSEIADIKAEDAVATSYDTKARQDDVENRFDDQMAGNTDVDEVIDARRPEGEEAYPTLRRRLDEEHQEVTSQLAKTENNLDSVFINVKYPPEPLIAAKGDGVNDDTEAIQNVINYVSEFNNGKVYIPSGEYRITSSLHPKGNNSVIEGSGYDSVISKDFEGNAIDGTIYRALRLKVKNLTIHGNSNNGHGIYSDGDSPGKISTFFFENIQVAHHGGDGVHVEEAWVSKIIDGRFNNNGGVGIYMENGNGNLIEYPNLTSNNIGIQIEGGSGVHINKPTIQDHDRQALKIGNCYGMVITNPYLEKNSMLEDVAPIHFVSTSDRAIGVSLISPFINNHSNSTYAIDIEDGYDVSIFNGVYNGVDTFLKTGSGSRYAKVFGVSMQSGNFTNYIDDEGARTSLFIEQTGTSSTRPTNPAIRGTPYFDTTINKPLWFYNTDWTTSDNIKADNSGVGIRESVLAESNKIDITFPAEEYNTLYSVFATPSWNTTFWVENKTTSGFTIRFGTPPATNKRVDWKISRS